MDSELVRTLLHEVLKEMLRTQGGTPSYASQFSADMQHVTLTNRVEALARQQGHVAESFSMDTQQQSLVVQALWELIVGGVLVPNHAQSSSQGWPFVSFTEHGKKVIFEERPTPYDPNAYLYQLARGGRGFDETARFYIEEALGCFTARRYTASTVMLGVASERLFDLLLDAFVDALASDKERETLEKKTDRRAITARYRELRKRLDPRKGQLPDPLADGLDTTLVSIFNLIRAHRNDAGHPTGRSIKRDEAYANLYVFPHYSAQMCEIVDHLEAYPQSLT